MTSMSAGLIQLRRPSRARAAAAAAPGIGDLQQAVVHELVEVIAGERATDARGHRGFVSADGLGGCDDEGVQPPAHVVGQRAGRVEFVARLGGAVGSFTVSF